MPQAGWASVKNGDLLTRAAASFDVFVAVDRNLSFQQRLPSYAIVVVVLRARSNRLADLRAIAPRLLEAIPVAKSGEALWVEP